MKGVRLPYLVFTLSESAPNRGSIKTASTLSIDIITPDAVCGSPKWLVRIRGTMASYACQNAEIRKKANPTSIVRLTFNFKPFIRFSFAHKGNVLSNGYFNINIYKSKYKYVIRKS
jgi:hypothetical protein